MNRFAIPLMMLAVTFCPGEAQAAATCSIQPSSGGTLVDFGTFSFLPRNRDAVGTLTLLCDGAAVPYELSVGTGSSGTFSPRTLRFGASALAYNLYVDASRSQILGDGNFGTGTIRGVCLGTSCEVMVHGSVFGGQVVPPGQYGDDVIVTLDFF